MKDVLVVIGTGGMGEAIARRLGSGKQVVLADFAEQALERVATALRGDGFDVHAVKVDVSSRASVEALAKTAAELGPVKQVAHTAGLSPVQAPRDAILGVDLAGVAYSLDAFGAVIADGGAGIVIASMAGTMTAGQLPAEVEAALARTPADELLNLPFLKEVVPNAQAAYGVSKRANQLRVQGASVIWGKRGGRVNTISPGVISTPMGQQELAGEAGTVMRIMIDGGGSQRIGTPADIADAAAFLLGPESTFVTGTDLLIDGGVVAAITSGAIEMPAA